MIVYVSILSIVSFIIVNTLLSLSGSYRKVLVIHAIDNSAIDSMERISRDLRWGTGVDTANSTFGSGNGALTIVENSGPYSTTTRFYLSNGIIKIDINGVYYGPLTMSNTTVSDLTFTKMDGQLSDAIKVDMTVFATSGPVVKSKKYHTTILMKGI